MLDRLFARFLGGKAAFRLGEKYYEGQVGPKDYAKAAKWYQLAAEHGVAAAQFNLAGMYISGEGIAQDYTQAMRWYRLAAEQGDARAQFNLGVMYAKGEGVPQDAAEAAKWYRLAAEQGDGFAEIMLGHIYENGEGVTRDYTESVKWYQRHAERHNDAHAQFEVGRIYGRMAEEDPSAYSIQAARWFQLAAKQGYAHAQFNLGLMYDNGLGVLQDYVLAHMWLNLAAAQGGQAAKEARDHAASHMTPDQISEAQRLAREWRPAAER